MTTRLLKSTVTQDEPEDFLAQVGCIFARFDAQTQDSGNVSYGVEIEGSRFFVKTAGAPTVKSFLPHNRRVDWLRNAVRLSRVLKDPVHPQLLNVVASCHGPMLVYEWVPGELIGVEKARRRDPDSAFVRFKALPLPDLTAALGSVFRVHADLCALGWRNGVFAGTEVL